MFPFLTQKSISEQFPLLQLSLQHQFIKSYFFFYLQNDTPLKEDKDQIAELANKLLMELCCSHTHGVNFYDRTLGTGGKYALYLLLETLLLNNCIIGYFFAKFYSIISNTKACKKCAWYYSDNHQFWVSKKSEISKFIFF